MHRAPGVLLTGVFAPGACFATFSKSLLLWKHPAPNLDLLLFCFSLVSKEDQTQVSPPP